MPEPLVGTNYITPDIVAKVTGRARYAEDFRADGMLFCKLMLSERPHARVVGKDLSRALALPGVRAILTAEDVPQLGGTTELIGLAVAAVVPWLPLIRERGAAPGAPPPASEASAPAATGSAAQAPALRITRSRTAWALGVR